MKKYNIIYSLGSDCSGALYLKEAKLRSYSSPFDWLTHANFRTRMELILNDFEDFLNIEDLVFMEKEPNVVHDEKCDYYHNTRNNFFFLHDFEVGKPLEESLPVVKEKYDRRIKRFYQEIKSSKKVLLVWFANYQVVTNEEALELCQKACKKFGKEVDFLFIEHDESMTIGDVKKVELAPNITRYFLFTAKEDDKGMRTLMGRQEDCLPLFLENKLIVPLRELTRKYSIKYLINLVPSSAKRKELREKYMYKF